MQQNPAFVVVELERLSVVLQFGVFGSTTDRRREGGSCESMAVQQEHGR
jgi:hypothetical protein